MMKKVSDIDPDQPLDQLMRQWPSAIRIFIENDIHCVGCSLAPFHCLKDAAEFHGIDEDTIARKIIAASD